MRNENTMNDHLVGHLPKLRQVVYRVSRDEGINDDKGTGYHPDIIKYDCGSLLESKKNEGNYSVSLEKQPDGSLKFYFKSLNKEKSKFKVLTDEEVNAIYKKHVKNHTIIKIISVATFGTVECEVRYKFPGEVSKFSCIKKQDNDFYSIAEEFPAKRFEELLKDEKAYKAAIKACGTDDGEIIMRHLIYGTSEDPVIVVKKPTVNFDYKKEMEMAKAGMEELKKKVI